MTSDQDSVCGSFHRAKIESVRFNHKPSASAMTGEAGFHMLWRMQKKAKDCKIYVLSHPHNTFYA